MILSTLESFTPPTKPNPSMQVPPNSTISLIGHHPKINGQLHRFHTGVVVRGEGVGRDLLIGCAIDHLSRLKGKRLIIVVDVPPSTVPVSGSNPRVPILSMNRMDNFSGVVFSNSTYNESPAIVPSVMRIRSYSKV